MSKQLDDVDRRIICLLGNDARISFSKIGKLLNLSHVAIRNRLVHLFERNIIRTSVLVNIFELSVEVAYLLIQTDGASITRKLIARFKDCPRIMQISTVLGQFDLIVMAFAENKRQLETILTTCLLRTADGIRNISVLSVGRLVSPPFFHIRFKKKSENGAPCGRDCTECEEYKLDYCKGCPATSSYNGILDLCLE